MKVEFDKPVNIVSVITLFIVVVNFVYSYGVRDAEIDSKFNTIDHKIQLLTDDRVHKATVDQMFVNRDLQILELKERLDRIDARVADSNKMIRELLKMEKTQ